MNEEAPHHHRLNDTELRIELARMDERLKATNHNVQRSEEASQRALLLQGAEYERRLSDLNHAHAQLMQMQASYIPREVFEREKTGAGERHDRLEARVVEMENFRSNLQGRMWIGGAVILIVAAAIAAIPWLSLRH